MNYFSLSSIDVTNGIKAGCPYFNNIHMAPRFWLNNQVKRYEFDGILGLSATINGSSILLTNSRSSLS